MEVIIVGGGIGGFATALSLHAAGIACRVYEALPEVRPLGVGINVLPHSIKELDDLGLLDRLEATGVVTRELVYASKRGEIVWREPRGRYAGYKWPQVSIHRGHLHMLLYQAARERIGDDRIHLNHTVVDVDSESSRPVVRFRATEGGQDLPAASGDVVIAADGIHSPIRAKFYPDEGPPAWSGMILWRGTTVWTPFLSGASMVVMGYAEQKFVTYPIRNLPDGRQLVNWIAELTFDEATLKAPQDWNRLGSRKDFLPRFEGWKTEFLDIPGLVRNSNEIYEYPMSDRNVVPSWVKGRVVLLGDAAHAMYPIGSNGASQAILDARRLAYELATRDSIDEALATYDGIRRPAMAKLLAMTREEGPDAVINRLEKRAPDGAPDLEQVVPMAERIEIAEQYKRTAGFSIETINTSPPLRPVAAV